MVKSAPRSVRSWTVARLLVAGYVLAIGGPHALTGAAGNVGAATLARLGSDLETRARAAALPAEPAAALATLRDELDRVVTAVAAVRAELRGRP